MPVYEYEHVHSEGCKLGKSFEFYQSIHEEKLDVCPVCKEALQKRIFPTMSLLKTHVSDSTLQQHGFTKLVRRDSGVYENVTASHNEPRYVQLQN